MLSPTTTLSFLTLLGFCKAHVKIIPHAKTATPTVMDSNRILCPVLAAMVHAGDLHPDEVGDVTLEDIYQGLTDRLGDGSANAVIQSTGIAGYDRDNKESELHRNRCLPGSPCDLKKRIMGVTDDTERWLNLYRMNGRQTVEHGYSTGVRGGATNVPEFDYTGGPCNGEYPCEERFQKFYASCANSNGDFYYENIECIMCKAWTMGDRGGEFAYNPTQSMQQWQSTTAINGWFDAFSRWDTNGTKYFTMADVRSMIMDAKYPQGWVKRSWGLASDFTNGAQQKLPCADSDGYNPVWWEGSSCESYTGVDCHISCDGGASCLAGRCVCGLGSNGVAMCAQNGKCVERENKCTYFGEPCVMIPADNPSAPW